jgi:hypothetical protein
MDADMGAVKELWWVIVMIGGPALCVVLWEKHKARQARKQWRSIADWEAFGGSFRDAYVEGYNNEIARQRQVRKDDNTFKTVEEYRNDSD